MDICVDALKTDGAFLSLIVAELFRQIKFWIWEMAEFHAPNITNSRKITDFMAEKTWVFLGIESKPWKFLENPALEGKKYWKILDFK